MAVYTKINKKDISSINKKFKNQKFLSFKGIKQGIENTNYLLKSKNNKFILTIFEKRVQKKEIPFFMKLMDQLNDLKIRCPKPLKNRDGKYLFKIKNKVACVVSFLDGKDKKNLSLKNCYDIGKTVAQMHSSSKKIRLFRKNSMNIKNLNPLLKSIKFKDYKFSKFNDIPYVTGKLAVSKNNKIYLFKKKITNEHSHKVSHLLRYRNQAILTSYKTINSDNPNLNCRIQGLEKFSPVKFIIDKDLKTKINSKVLKLNSNKTYIFHNIN